MKRIVLFVLTNLAVVLVLSIVLNVVLAALGVPARGTEGLLVIAFVFGMGGSLISLALSKTIARASTGAQVIEQPRTTTERWLLDTVARLARQAGVGTPEVAVYDAPDINAFATGMRRNQALVAVSTGLLENLSADEAEAVLGHELSHVANGDMVTLSLLQGVLNTFVIFLSRILGGVIDSALRGNREQEGYGLAYFAVVMLLEVVFGVLASLIVMWFSRRREFRADAGGARLAGRSKMIAALERLRQHAEPTHLPEQMTAFGINGTGSRLARLFASHPPLEERIAALRALPA